MEQREKKLNIGDLIIKAILIIIIILLLVHNCATVNKLKGKDDDNKSIPTGNVDIFEIQCEKDVCKDVLGDQTETQKPEPEKPSVSPSGNTGNNTTTNQNNTNNNNNNNSGNTEPSGGNTSTDEPTTDDNFIVKDTVEWKSQNELRIFANPVYQMDNKIAPESSNTYEFIVRNNTSYNVKYSIDFDEENESNINMRYRLKKDGAYVVGNDTTWVRYNDLDLENITLNSSNDHIYYLEWKWFSSDNDTAIGANSSSKYKLNIVISAESQNA